MTKRFIEESFPIREVSLLSAHEKNIRRGHISALHIWWARRPLASSRTTAYAALIPAPGSKEEERRKRKFIIDLAKWENSTNSGLIEAARRDVLAANGGAPPRVLDPFAGGGSIPLEALRLGCDTYASELNPVAVLIEKATLEYPQKYGDDGQKTLGAIPAHALLNDVKKWANKVFDQANEELKRFYPEEDGCVHVGYIWARTIPCQNPLCEAEIPLMRQFWLAKKSKQKVAVFPFDDDGKVKFKVVGTGYEAFPNDFNPDNGTVSKAIATCIICGSVVSAKTTKRLFQEGKSGQRMVAVVLSKQTGRGKLYRIATSSDLAVFEQAEERLKDKRGELFDKWGIDPVPDEPTPEGGGRGAERAFSVKGYGFGTWGDLFNARQKLSLITFVEKIQTAYSELLQEYHDPNYSKAITVYLALIFDKLAVFSSSNCTWKPSTTQNVKAFAGRQAVQIVWDYFEMNPISGVSTSWPNLLGVFGPSLNVTAGIDSSAKCENNSATSLPYVDNFFDAVFTDPPYYDNVPYSYLSDFFYVWLKRMIGELYPDLLSTQLTPKKNEIVAYSNWPGGFEEGKDYFESLLKKSFGEIHRVLKPNGIAIIVYAHKSTAGWETLINSLLDSGLIITGSWPLNTEMRSRLRAMESAALASSIYIVARKMTRAPTAFYNEVKEELKNHLNSKLEHLWLEQSESLDPSVKKLLGREIGEMDLFSGADFFITAIGSAIEVFGKYEKVMDYEGSIVRADKLLDDAQEIVTDYVVKQILHNGFGGEIAGLTRFYILWRWNYGEAKVPFDDARKLAQSCGIDLTQEWGKGRFIRREGEFVRVLGPYSREIESLPGSRELIDVLHNVCLLWGSGKRDEMIAVLDETGFGSDEAFYRVAQAISETLPNESKEKKLLEGFLAGKERLRRDMKQTSGQVNLSDWAS